MNLDRFKIKHTLILMVISCVPLILFGYLAYKKEVNSVKEKAISNLETIAVQSVLVVDKFRTDCIDEMKLTATLLAGLDENREIDLIKSMLAQRVIVKQVFIADATGKIRFSLSGGNSAALGANFTSQKWFKNVTSGGVFTGDINSREGGGKRYFLVAVPTGSPERRITGVLMACIDFSGIAQIIKSTPIGHTGEIYLVNREGVFLTTTRIGKAKPGERILDRDVSQYLVKDTSGEYIDYRGVRVIRVYKRLYDLDWTLIVEQDSTELFSDIRIFNNIFLAFTGLFIMFAIIGSYLVSVKIARLLKNAYEREKELEMQLIQKDKLASMGLLTAGIAHELNTPLANALLSTQMLKEDTKQIWPAHMKKLNSIEEEIKRGGAIVRNLLDFSRQSHMNSAVTDVNDVLKKLLDLANKLCHDKNIHVRRTLSIGIPHARGNASILHQVFMNIVTNAIEAMPNGGTLDVLSKYLPALHKIVVEIRDTGPGIPDEYIGGVFDPFFTTKASEVGTGLGLAISYTMVKKMGGDIKVTSSCKEKQDSAHSSTGTTFSIELPAYDNDCRHSENREGEEK